MAFIAITCDRIVIYNGVYVRLDVNVDEGRMHTTAKHCTVEHFYRCKNIVYSGM